MADSNQQSPQKPPKKYGKRPVWFWILIYLGAAILVYGVIYLSFFGNGGDDGGGPQYQVF